MVESSPLAPLHAWLVNPLDGEVHDAIERLRRRVLAKLAGAVPARRWNRKMTMEPPHDVASDTLSDPRLDAVWRKQGTLELATLGSGNHFAELQVDGEDRL